MKRWSRTLIVLALAGIAVTMAYRYEEYLVKRNFIMVANVPCDPSTEACFALDCDPGDAECEATPYKKAEILASEAPACVEEHTCESFSCDGASSCSVTYCAEDTLEDGELCVEPEPAAIQEEEEAPVATTTGNMGEGTE
jgi:hypothetical protein